MKSRNHVALFGLVAVLIIFSATGCKNLFQVGLGASVDLEPPEISLSQPAVNDFLRGSVEFRGRATDDTGVEIVEYQYMSAVDSSFSEWKPVDALENDVWTLQLNTRELPDGRLRMNFRVTDIAGKRSLLLDQIYGVDNTPPVVLVTEPRRYSQLVFNTQVVLTVSAADVHAIRKFGSVVEKSTDEGATWTEIERQEVQQSTTWTKIFESGNYTSDEEPEAWFRFFVWAEDEARNRSTQFYHIDKLNELSSRPWTADQLRDALASGTSPSPSAIRATSFPKQNKLDLIFDELGDIPVIEWISPVAAEDGGIPGTGSRGLLAGLFRDDDGIDIDSAEIKIQRSPDFKFTEYTQARAEGGTAVFDYIESLEWFDVPDGLGWRRPELVAQDIRSVSWDYRLPEGMGQGYFRAHLYVVDIDGTPSLPYYQLFIISDGSPTVEIDSPENINFSDRFVLTGKASPPSEDVGLEGVNIALRDSTQSGLDWGDIQAYAADFDPVTQKWTFDTASVPGLDLSQLSDGNITVRAIAFIGEDSDARQVNLVKDTVAPEIDINNPEAGSFLNRIAQFRGVANDALSGVAGIDVRVEGTLGGGSDVLVDWTGFSTSAYSLAADGFEFSGTATNWTLKIDTEKFEDAPLELFVRATDRAGNQHESTRAFEIYQDSDLPVMSISNMDEDGGRFDNVLSGDPRLIGSVSDDDGVNPDSFRYRVWRTIDNEWSAWRYVYSSGERSPTPRLDFNIPLMNPNNPGQFLGDGSHLLQLWIEDIDGIGLTRIVPTDNDPVPPESGKVLNFSVDKGAPTVTIASPSSSFVTNNDFSIIGQATDGFGIELIQISFDGGDSYEEEPLYKYENDDSDPETVVPINYLVTVGDEGNVQDGTYNIRLRARDLSGSEATENITVTIDTTPPTIEFIRPEDGQTVNAGVLIQGSANDNMQVHSVYWYITPEGDTPPDDIGEWNLFPNRYSWEYTWDTYAYQNNIQGNFDPAGYDFHVRARDTAANWGEIATLTLQVDQESDRPSLEISNLDLTASGMPDPLGTTPGNLFGSDALITGSVQDDDGVTGGGIAYRTRSWDWNADEGAGAFGAWSATDEDDWEPVANTFTGTRTNATWSQPVALLGDGVHEIEFRVRDIRYDSERPLSENFNWNTIGPISFAINTANPQLDIVSGLASAGTTFIGDDAAFSGTASDSIGVYEVRASFYPDNNPDDLISLEVNGTSAWDTEFPVARGEPEQLADGDYIVVITATDRLGRSTSISRSVYVDTEAPTITVGNLSENDLISTEDFTINGTASDGSGSGVATIEYSLDSGATWAEAAGTTRWSVALEGLEESLENSIRLRSSDLAGNQSDAIIINFRVDLNPPEISDFVFSGINTVGSQNYARDEFGFSFNASDTQGLKSVTVTRTGDAGTVTVFTEDYTEGVTADTILVTQNQPDSELDEGDYTYSIVVEDIANRTATLNRTVIVDTTAPDVEITNLRPVLEGDFLDRVNGTIEFSVAAGDSGGLVSNGVKWWIIRSDAASGEPVDWSDVRGAAFITSPYKALFNTDSGTDSDGDAMQDETEYTLYIIARDRAGNETKVEQEFLVDQSSDWPTVSFTDVNPGISTAGELQTALDGGDQDNLLELNARIRGTISDDDRIDRDTIEIALNVESPQDADFDLVSTRGSSGRSVTFSHNLIDVAGLGDGVHFFYLRFSDDANVKLGTDPLVRTTTVGPVYFVIDTQNPTLAITAPGVNSYQGNSFTVTGTASDASGIDRVRVSLDGGATWGSAVDTSGAEEPAYKTWSYQATVAEDDIVAIQVRAFDAFDKNTTVERQVTVDTTPPETTINEPGIGATVNGVVRLRGTTNDDFTVAATYYYIAESSVVPPDPTDDLTGWTAFGGAYSWEYYWNSLEDHDSEDPQDYTLHVAARDSAGNWSEPNSVTLTVDQTTNLPVVTINNPDGQLLDNTGVISGTATDDDGINSGTMEISFDGGSTWRPVSHPGTGGFFVNWSHVISTAPGLPERFDPYEVQVRVNDIGDDSSGVHTIDPVTGTSNVINIRKNDSLPDSAITEISNGIRTATTLQGVYVSDYFRIEGTATDGVGIDTVEARLVGIAGHDVFEEVIDISGEDPPFATWEWEKSELNLSGLSSVTIEIRSTDLHGRFSTRSYTILVDSEAPAAAIETQSENPDTASGAYNGLVTYRGTATDNVQVEKVYYRFEEADPGPPDTDFIGWSEAAGVYNWNAQLDTRTVHDLASDYTYNLYVVAVDAAGNVSATESLSFTINQASDRPVLSLSTPDDDELLGQGAKAIGSVYDDDGLSSIEIRIAETSAWGSITDGDYVPVDSPASVSGRNVFFEHDLSEFSDGSYTMQMRIRDSNWVNDTDTPFNFYESTPVEFAIDVDPPSIDIARMVIDARYVGEDDRVFTSSFNGRFVNNDLTLYLDASDDSGLEFVQIRIDEDAWIPAVLETEGEFVGLYRATIDGIIGGDLDGDRTIHYRARDNSGKTTARFISVVVDTKAPETEFITDSSEVYRTVRVRGLVEEENPLEKTYLWIGEVEDLENLPEAPTDMSDWDREVTGSYSWYYDFDTTVEDPQGWYRLVARTRDRAGNLSDPVGLLLDLNQEADRPEINLSNLTNTAEPSAGQNTLSSPIISGYVTDDDRVAGNSMQIRIREAGEETWPAWEILPTVDDAFFVNWSYNFDLPDGVYEMGFRVLDTMAVNLVDVMDPDNYAADNYNWQEIGSVKFFIAANPPEITVWDPDLGGGTGTMWSANNRKAYRGDFTVNGNVTSSSDNTFMQFRTQEVGQPWTAWEYVPSTWDGASGTIPANTTTDWSFTVTIDGEVPEGEYGLQIRAVDSLGGVTTRPGAGEQPFRYFVDRTKPTVISADATNNAQGRVDVTGSDDVFIYGFRYVTRPADGSNPPGANPNEWIGFTDHLLTSITESVDYYDGAPATFETGGNPWGGGNRMYFAMRDRAGNWSDIYRIDRYTGLAEPPIFFLESEY
ncbi:Ig-like domain-containing protein [Spirochaeta dissipatitropha]